MTNHNKLRRTGAVLNTMLALGGLSAKAVEASPLPESAHLPETAAQVNNEVDDHNLTDPAAINAEAYAAFKKIKSRWQGVIAIREPQAKGVDVGFYTSPHSDETVQIYENYSSPADFTGGDGDKHTAIIVYEPALVKFKGEDYLVVYSQASSKYGYLKLKPAIKSGAVLSYAIKGKSPKPIKYDPMKIGIMPNIVANQDVEPSTTHPNIYEMYPHTIGVNGRPLDIDLEPTKIMPHL